MAKKTCPNGHIFDPNIYGDQCPLCPTAVSSPASNFPKTQIGGTPNVPPNPRMHTQVANNPSAQNSTTPAEAVGETIVRSGNSVPSGGKRTVIRHVGNPMSGANAPSRKLVGFLITYNRDPNGRAYNIYEGRNFIGRDASCDISIPDDDQMSGKHLSILYRNIDDKFKFNDEMSSNGTFVNKQLLDNGELQNYDIIRAGSTIFIFLAIPKIS